MLPEGFVLQKWCFITIDDSNLHRDAFIIPIMLKTPWEMGCGVHKESFCRESLLQENFPVISQCRKPRLIVAFICSGCGSLVTS